MRLSKQARPFCLELKGVSNIVPAAHEFSSNKYSYKNTPTRSCVMHDRIGAFCLMRVRCSARPIWCVFRKMTYSRGRTIKSWVAFRGVL